MEAYIVPGTTISSFAGNLKKKKKLMPTDRPYIFLTCDSKHTYIFFWPYGNTMVIHFRNFR
jgi:hypothetical protein